MFLLRLPFKKIFVFFLFLLDCFYAPGWFCDVDVVDHIRRVLNEPRHEKNGFLHMRKNKDADQRRSNREADQRLCFRYKDSTIPLLSKSEIYSL